ncbi:hypothetical protein [Maritimibacter sp. 55A14]|uniref:hypothetical protein n=1 Tax=Maritimibacter sp. 55A14 TaxID=2174844 RepID=UPI0018EEAA28|nr:hypothetical protein [Maritimibacter sp. 55A14]
MAIDHSHGDRPKDALLQAAREQFERTRRQLRDVLARIEAGEAAAVAQLETARQQLSKSLTNAIQEESRFEEFCKAERGAVHGHAIDFDAARAEIGRRLARLRDSGGGGGVSGRPE